jgi:Fe-S cluster assembly iron-binding protein IscA
MMRITEDAATLVAVLASADGPSSQSGLRIVIDPVHQSLSMGIARSPQPDDTVVSKGSARVFLAPSAAHRLRNRTLRAEMSAGRSLFFLDN